MEKRRGFILATLLLLLLFGITSMLFFFTSGWRLSNGIVYLSYVTTFDGSLYGSFVIGFSSLSLLFVLIGVPVGFFFLLLTFIFFLLYPRHPKLTIPMYILLVLTYLSVLGTFVGIIIVEGILNTIDIVFNGLFLGSYAYFYNDPVMGMGVYKVESICIEDIVKGGLLIMVDLIALCITIIPFITLILSFVVGRRKKKEE